MNSRQRRAWRRWWRPLAERAAFPGAPLPVVEMTQAEIEQLPEYTFSIPTGGAPGKRWRANLVAAARYWGFARRTRHLWRWLRPIRSECEAWYIGEVTDDLSPDGYAVRWSRVRIVPPRDEVKCKRCKRWRPLLPGANGVLYTICCDHAYLVQADGTPVVYDLSELDEPAEEAAC